MRLKGPIDTQKVAAIFQTLSQQHDLLRTSFTLVEDTPAQLIHDQVPFELPLIPTTEAELPHLVAAFIQPFSLEQAPLFRVALAQIDNNHHVLMTDMHHIIADGLSRDLLLEDFVRLYNGQVIPPQSVQFKDYVVWLESEPMQAKREQQKAFWLEQFAEPVQPLQLPTNFKRPSIQSFEGSSVFFDLTPPETNQLRALAQQEDATLYMVLLSAYYILLAGLSGQEDIVIGTPTMGRRYPGTEKMFGMLVNTITLRNHPHGDKPYRQFLQEVKANALAVFENQDYPFDELVGELNLERDVSRNPLFDVVFTYQNMAPVEATIPGVQLIPYQHENQAALFDLMLVGEEIAGGIHFELEYAAKLFRKERVQQFVTYFKQILQTIRQHPDLRLSEITLLPQAEQKRLLYDFNATAAPFPHHQTIIQLFEAQVVATPQAPAIVSGDITLTYQQLNGQANHLAWQLKEKGIASEMAVALLLEHAPEIIIAMLAVLKAGGAYVPIDPTLPEARIQYMVKDSGANILLSQPHLLSPICLPK